MKQNAAGLRVSLDAVKTVPELLELVQAVDDETALDGLLPSAVDAFRARFAPRVLRFIAQQERQEAEALRARAGDHDGEIAAILGANRWGAYAGMARALELVDLSGCERLAMVGCGPFPDSLFCLHDRTTVPVLAGFDQEPVAVERAAALVAALGLERITIAEADAARLDYSGFDAVCCSVFATPRREILARIATTAPEGAAVIAREPVGIGTLLFEPVLDALPDGLQMEARAEPAGGPFKLAYAALAVTASRNERSMKSSGTRST